MRTSVALSLPRCQTNAETENAKDFTPKDDFADQPTRRERAFQRCAEFFSKDSKTESFLNKAIREDGKTYAKNLPTAGKTSGSGPLESLLR
jgi:hypothetical protein